MQQARPGKLNTIPCKATCRNMADYISTLMALLVVALCSTSGSGYQNTKSTTLSLTVLLPLSSPEINGENFLPSLDITLELINNRSDLLSGFTVDAKVADSAVSWS